MGNHIGVRNSMSRASILAALCALVLLAVSCPGGGGGGQIPPPAIASAYWGHWTDASNGRQWYISDSKVLDPDGAEYALQQTAAEYIVVYRGGTNYRIDIGSSGLLKLNRSGSGSSYLYKRNGSDAPFRAELWQRTAAKILGPAGNVSLTLQNVLNASNQIAATSSNSGLLTVPAQAIAGDDYLVKNAAGSAIGTIHLGSPGENAGVISIAPPSLGYTFKASIVGAGPLDFRYPDGTAHDLVLVLRNTGSVRAAGISYTLAPSIADLSLSAREGSSLSGGPVDLDASSSLEIPIRVSMADSSAFSGEDYLEPAAVATITAGGETWTDRVPLRFYRERRWVSFISSAPIRGYLMGPEKVAIAVSTEGYTRADIALPYRTSPYEAFLFPDLSYPWRNPNTQTIDIAYAAAVSTGSDPTAEPLPLYSSGQPYMSLGYAGGPSNMTNPEAWNNYFGLNDGNEPNESLGSGPTIYRGLGFKGYLTDGDFDAYTIDFSKDDPAASDGDKSNDFEFRYYGSLCDVNGDGYNRIAGDGDGLAEPGEKVLVQLDLRSRLPIASIADWQPVIRTTGDGASIAVDWDEGPSYYLGSFADLFAGREENTASAWAAVNERPIALYVKVPTAATPGQTVLSNGRIRLRLEVRNASGATYGDWFADIPVSAAP